MNLSPKVTESYKEQRRLEIMKAAEAVFKRKGYEASTMQDIIEETGMSRGGVYLYFAGKDELIQALLEADQLEQTDGYGKLLAGTKSTWEAIEVLMQIQVEDTMGVRDSLLPVVYEYFLSGRDGEAQSDYLMKRYQNALNSFEAFIQTGVERGEFTPLLPLKAIGRTIISMLDGILIHAYFVRPENADVTGQFAVIREYLRHVLQVKSLANPESDK